MNRKIERVEVFGVAMPLIGTFTSAGISKQATKCVVVRLTASDGTVGISSIEPSAGSQVARNGGGARSRDPRAHRARDRRTGSDQHQPPDRAARQAHADAARRRLPASEMACVELASRMQGVPLYTYLGGAVQDERAIQRLDRDAAARGSGGGSEALAQGGIPFREDQGRQRRRSRSRPHRSGSRSGRQRDEAAHRRQHASTTPTRRSSSAAWSRNSTCSFSSSPRAKDDLAGHGARAARRRHSGDGGRIGQRSREPARGHQGRRGGLREVRHQAGRRHPARVAHARDRGGRGHSRSSSATASGSIRARSPKIMLAASSRNVLPGLECVGPAQGRGYGRDDAPRYFLGQHAAAGRAGHRHHARREEARAVPRQALNRDEIQRPYLRRARRTVGGCNFRRRHRAGEYPNRPIRLIVPFAPGGGSDFMGRLVGQKLTEQMGQQVVVDNRPGAASLVGTQIASRGAPDGYTLILPMRDSRSTRLLQGPELRRAQGFRSHHGDRRNAVHPGGESRACRMPRLKEFIAAAKAQPGKIAIGSAGSGSGTHMTGELSSCAPAST